MAVQIRPCWYCWSKRIVDTGDVWICRICRRVNLPHR